MSVAERVLPPAPPPDRVFHDQPCSVLLHNVSWEIYQALRNDESNNHLRMTYDQGELEIMSPQKKHGRVATLLGLMIYEWTRLHRIEIESGRDLTCAREDLLKGLEPDLCYWIANQPVVHGRDEWDSMVDPPPDLALEVNATRSSIPKLPIYEALKVPEVWRWRKGIEVLRLQDDGHYAKVTDSGALPAFPLKLAEAFLERRNELGENALMEQFETAIASLPR